MSWAQIADAVAAARIRLRVDTAEPNEIRAPGMGCSVESAMTRPRTTAAAWAESAPGIVNATSQQRRRRMLLPTLSPKDRVACEPPRKDLDSRID